MLRNGRKEKCKKNYTIIIKGMKMDNEISKYSHASLNDGDTF